MNDRKILMKGYNSNDPFVVMGRNGAVLKQPRPGVMFLPDVTEYSLGKGTVVKDSDDDHDPFAFRIRYKSAAAPATDPEYASDGDYRACTYRGTGIYRQNDDMSLYGMEGIVTTEGSRGIDEAHNYYWLFPYEPSGSTHGNFREIGHGPNPFAGTMRFNRGSGYRDIQLIGSTYRTEIYVVVSMKDMYIGRETTTSVLDNNVRAVIIPYRNAAANYNTVYLNRVRTWNNGLFGSSERMQLWVGKTELTITSSSRWYPPVLNMLDGDTMVGITYSDAFRVNVSSTYIFKDNG